MKGIHPRSSRAAPPRSRGFTLVELLVVLAVVAALIALRLPTLANAERGTKIAQCSSNLRQFTLATLIYAGENGDKLPSNSGAGFWPWDMAWSTGDALLRYETDWKVMYCPGTAPRFTESDFAAMFGYSPGNFRIVGYAMTLPGTSSVNPTNLNSTLTPPVILGGFGLSGRELPSDRVLLADAILSEIGQNNEALRNTYNYTSIPGGFPKPHVSAHLSGKLPLGGNLGMLDGHVEWRNFPSMHVRVSGTSSPTFWW